MADQIWDFPGSKDSKLMKDLPEFFIPLVTLIDFDKDLYPDIMLTLNVNENYSRTYFLI